MAKKKTGVTIEQALDYKFKEYDANTQMLDKNVKENKRRMGRIVDWLEKEHNISRNSDLSAINDVKALEKIANQKKFDFQIKNQMADSYYQTLEMWRKNFNNKWDIIKNLGYSEDFKRMWNFYLSYCSGGFKAKTIDVYQIDFINK